jgi:hypothetical protein
MTNEQGMIMDRPTVDEIREMLERVVAIYGLGGPLVSVPWAAVPMPWRSDDWHGGVLIDLANAPAEAGPEWTAAFLEEHDLDANGMRCLVRLTASYAMAVALSWVLQEPFDNSASSGCCYPESPRDADGVEDEATGFPFWAFDTSWGYPGAP